MLASWDTLSAVARARDPGWSDRSCFDVALFFLAFTALLAAACPADTVITRDGTSYSGNFLGAKNGTIGFTDTSGIGYTFPVGEVQSLVFTSANDTVTLRNGKVYSGKASCEAATPGEPRSEVESVASL